MATSKNYDNQTQALNFLSEHCQAFGITPPDFLILTGQKIKLGRTPKEREGSPVYYANELANGHINIRFHSFKGGEFKAQYYTGNVGGDTTIPATLPPPLQPQAEPAPKPWFNNIKKRYEKASGNYSNYLKNSVFDNKTLQEYAPAINGIRYDNGAAIIPIGTNAFQVIETNGVKAIYAEFDGATKGQYVLIGSIPDNYKSIIYITEGIRTGLAVYIATEQPVICAISAGKLKEIAWLIRKLYLKAEIVIAGDNDRFNKNGIERLGLLDNPGVSAAHKAAWPVKAQVAIPPIIEHGKSCDWWDFLQANGLELTSAAIADATNRPDPKTALLKREPVSTGTRYLPNWNPKPGVIEIANHPIGNGKTVSCQDAINASNRVVYVAHRTSLAIDAAAKLTMQCYLDGGLDVATASKLAICLNSIYRLTITNADLSIAACKYDTLIIDEIEQLLVALTKPYVKNKSLVLGMLVNLLKNTPQIRLMDANITDVTRNFLKRLGLDKSVEIIKGGHLPGIGCTVELFDTRDVHLNMVVEALNAGERHFIPLNSKHETELYYKELQIKCPNKNGLCIHAGNTENRDVDKYLKDVNGESPKYDYVVVSPVANSGISIDMIDGKPAFDAVSGVAFNGINLHTDVIQQLGRVRGITKINLFVENRDGAKPRTREQVAARLQQIALEGDEVVKARLMAQENVAVLDHRFNSITGQLEPIDKVYAELCVDVKLQEEWSHYKFYDNVLKELAKNGYEFKYSNLKSTGETKALYQQVKKLTEQDYLESTSEAPYLDVQSKLRLKEKLRRTQDETNALTKTEIVDFYSGGKGEDSLPDLLPEVIKGKLGAGAEEVPLLPVENPLQETHEFIDQKEKLIRIISKDKRGKYRRAIRENEIRLLTPEEIEDKILDEVQHKVPIPDRKPYIAQQWWANLFWSFILTKLLALGSFSPSRNEKTGKGYNAQSPEIQEFVTQVLELRGQTHFEAVVKLPSEKKLREKPLEFIRDQLQKFGLKQSCIHKTKSSRHYGVDVDSVSELIKILYIRNPHKKELIDNLFSNGMSQIKIKDYIISDTCHSNNHADAVLIDKLQPENEPVLKPTKPVLTSNMPPQNEPVLKPTKPVLTSNMPPQNEPVIFDADQMALRDNSYKTLLELAKTPIKWWEAADTAQLTKYFTPKEIIYIKEDFDMDQLPLRDRIYKSTLEFAKQLLTWEQVINITDVSKIFGYEDLERIKSDYYQELKWIQDDIDAEQAKILYNQQSVAT